jgi:hypothetical protein
MKQKHCGSVRGFTVIPTKNNLSGESPDMKRWKGRATGVEVSMPNLVEKFLASVQC